MTQSLTPLSSYLFLSGLQFISIALFATCYWRAGASQPSRSFEQNFRYIVRRTSCKCACATLYALPYPKPFPNFYTRDMRRPIQPPRELSSIRRHALQPSVTGRGCTSSEFSVYPYVVRRVSAHARLCTRFFLSESNFQIFLHIFTRDN